MKGKVVLDDNDQIRQFRPRNVLFLLRSNNTKIAGAFVLKYMAIIIYRLLL